MHKASLPRPFVCNCKRDDFGSARIHLEGELDLATLPTFRHTLEAQLDTNIVSVDLQGLDFIDCAALGLLVETDAISRRSGRRLILVRGSGQVDRLLALSGVLERLEVVGPPPRRGATQRSTAFAPS